MSQQIISEAAHVQEFERMMARLFEIVEQENTALEQGDVRALAPLQQEKGRLSFLLQRKWNSYKQTLLKGDNKRRQAFQAIDRQIEDLKHAMTKNQKLLTIAKVTSANRIAAGMDAWKQYHDKNAPSYGMDGCSDPYQTGPNATLSRLI